MELEKVCALPIGPPGFWVKIGPAFLGPWLPLNIPKDFFVY